MRSPGRTVLTWDGPEESIAQGLECLVRSKEVWLASIEGADFPEHGDDDPASLRVGGPGGAEASLRERHCEAGARWIATIGDIGRRGAWSDRLIDALCDPPESFVLGSVVVHVLTFAAHRRQSARHMLREAGVEVGHGDPIEWLQDRYGGTT